MGSIAQATTTQFEEEVLGSDVPVLVDFYAPWCGPCRRLAPALEQTAKKFSEKARVVKVNVDDEPELASRYQITGVPTLLFVKDGQVVERVVGVLPLAGLETKLGALVA